MLKKHTDQKRGGEKRYFMENLSQNALKIDNRRQKTALYNNKGMNTKNKTLHTLCIHPIQEHINV